MRKYLRSQEAETHELEKMLENMKYPPSILSDRAIPLAEFTSQDRDISTTTLEKYEQWES